MKRIYVHKLISPYRDMFAVFSVTIFCLLSVSHSATLCEDLVRPLEQLDPQHLVGRWALVADSLSPTVDGLKLSSMTVYFSNSSETSVYSYNQFNRVDEQCHHLSYNLSIENSTFTHNVDKFFQFTWSILYTSCPDCLIIRWVLEYEGRKSVELTLFSKRREVEQKEIEEFQAQMECLKMPPPVVMDPTKKLCPEKTTSDPAA